MTPLQHRNLNTIGWVAVLSACVALYLIHFKSNTQIDLNTHKIQTLKQCEIMLFEDLTKRKYPFSKDSK